MEKNIEQTGFTRTVSMKDGQKILTKQPAAVTVTPPAQVTNLNALQVSRARKLQEKAAAEESLGSIISQLAEIDADIAEISK